MLLLEIRLDKIDLVIRPISLFILRDLLKLLSVQTRSLLCDINEVLPFRNASFAQLVDLRLVESSKAFGLSQHIHGNPVSLDFTSGIVFWCLGFFCKKSFLVQVWQLIKCLISYQNATLERQCWSNFPKLSRTFFSLVPSWHGLPLSVHIWAFSTTNT